MIAGAGRSARGREPRRDGQSDPRVRGGREPFRRSQRSHCQRPPAFAHSSRWSTEQKSSGMRCSPAAPHEQDVDLAQLPAAVRAGDRARRVEGGSASSPASQCAPWIAQGTTCSRRQKAARRSSPRAHSSRKPSSVVDVGSAPGACIGDGGICSHPMAGCQHSRARGRPDRAGASRAGAPGAGSRTSSGSTSSSCASTSRSRTGAAPRTRSCHEAAEAMRARRASA